MAHSECTPVLGAISSLLETRDRYFNRSSKWAPYDHVTSNLSPKRDCGFNSELKMIIIIRC